VVLAVSAEVPSDGFGVHPDLDPEVKRRLREALLVMDSREDGRQVLHQFQAQRFVATSLKDYEPVLRWRGGPGSILQPGRCGTPPDRCRIKPVERIAPEATAKVNCGG